MLFEIKVTRNKANGRLVFRSGKVNVSATCWWDPKVKINPGTYTAYATRMARKLDSATGQKRPGIWFGRGVPYNGNGQASDNIFIHEGTGPAWSDGCIVLARRDMMKVWDAITPKERPNVQVTVVDAAG